MRKRKETKISLEYKIRTGNYGFINGEWTLLHTNQPMYPVEIEFYLSLETDQMYQKGLDNDNPLAYWWGS
jgi:hypothetical protein